MEEQDTTMRYVSRETSAENHSILVIPQRFANSSLVFVEFSKTGENGQ